MSTPPATIVSFARHAHVPSTSDAECTPDFSRHGRRDATRVTARLADLTGVITTSPAKHVRATVEGVTDAADAPLIIDDNPRERELVDPPIEDFDEAAEHLWANPNVSHPDGESYVEVQARGAATADRLVEAYPDRHVVVGTHTTLMTLVFNAYDPRYGREFWTGLATPDVYEVTFVDSEAFSIARTWTPEETTRESDAGHGPAKR